MKLYRTKSLAAEDDAVRLVWSGTQADASKDRARLKADGHKDIKTEDVDVPTDKQGLLAWLNANVTGE